MCCYNFFIKTMMSTVNIIYNSNAIVPKIIYELLIDSVKDISDTTDVIQYVLSVMFFSRTKGKLTFNCCGQTAKRISALLWGLRAGICGYIAVLKSSTITNESWEALSCNALDPIQNGFTINRICPIISQLRNMYARKPKKKNAFFSNNRDVIVGSHKFRYEIWSEVIPLIAEKIDKQFDDIFGSETTWRGICYGENDIQVRNWNDGDILVKLNSSNYSSIHHFLNVNSLHLTHLQTSVLTSLFEVAFHGLGCGSSRFTQIENLKLSDTSFINNNVYYYPVSEKKVFYKSIKANSSKTQTSGI